MKSSSSSQHIPLGLKIQEWRKQFEGLVRSRAPWAKRDFSWLEEDLLNYSEAVRQFGGFELSSAIAFEIGCGQRPYRLFYLSANGINVEAVDLDKVSMGMSLGDFIESLNSNGLERSAKTLLRSLLFDGADNRAFRALISKITNGHFEWPMERIKRGSAADCKLWPETKVDFIYSEDVFEHIPAAELPVICQQMRSRMSNRGIAWIKPVIFTGIQGGHSVDWYSLDEDRHRSCPPWDHLRSRRFPANTYLNELTRADYRALFSEAFEILEEREVKPDLGRNFMTSEIRAELADYSDEDLFSNGVVFILKPKAS